jgi:adenylyltransferase/sulfurtransferase
VNPRKTKAFSRQKRRHNAAHKETAMTTQGCNMTPMQLSELLDQGADLCLLDVREPAEVAAGKIGNCLTIPLGILPLRFDELPRNTTLVVYCKMGGRSAQAVQFLQSKGFTNVRNLVGGIVGWMDHVDPSLTKY